MKMLNEPAEPPSAEEFLRGLDQAEIRLVMELIALLRQRKMQTRRAKRQERMAELNRN